MKKRQRVALDVGMMLPLLRANVALVENVMLGGELLFIKVCGTAVATSDVGRCAARSEGPDKYFSDLKHAVLRSNPAKKLSYNRDILRGQGRMTPLLLCRTTRQGISNHIQRPRSIHNLQIQGLKLLNPTGITRSQGRL